MFFSVRQKTAYEMRISDWSSDVCSSDLVGAFYMATTNDERRGRLLNFIDPFKEYHDAGWQPAHGLYALSTGGWFGQGIGASQQKWGDLPEAHTDFIFAVLGEEDRKSTRLNSRH